MKHIIVLLLVICNIKSKAQVIVSYFDYNWKECKKEEASFIRNLVHTDSGWLKTNFYIATNKVQLKGLYSDSACKKANGVVQFYFPNYNLEAVGTYKNGKQNGEFKSYHYTGQLRDSGNYVDGKLVGTHLGWYRSGFLSDSIVTLSNDTTVNFFWFNDGSASSAGKMVGRKKIGSWQFFHKNGGLAAKTKYLNDSLIYEIYYDKNGATINDTSLKHKKAAFGDSPIDFVSYLSKKLTYPKEEKFNGRDKVTVVVNFKVAEDGSIIEAYVEVPFQTEFDEIALNVITHSPNWKHPALLMNRHITFPHKQAITFSRQKSRN